MWTVVLPARGFKGVSKKQGYGGFTPAVLARKLYCTPSIDGDFLCVFVSPVVKINSSYLTCCAVSKMNFCFTELILSNAFASYWRGSAKWRSPAASSTRSMITRKHLFLPRFRGTTLLSEEICWDMTVTFRGV